MNARTRPPVRRRIAAALMIALSTTVIVDASGAEPLRAQLFADGFESGSMSAWTASSGVTVRAADRRTG